MANIEIVYVEVLPDYKLYVKHANGVEGIVDMKPETFREGAGPLHTVLQDPEIFKQVKIDCFGGLTWYNGDEEVTDACYHWTYWKITGKDPHEVEQS